MKLLPYVNLAPSGNLVACRGRKKEGGGGIFPGGQVGEGEGLLPLEKGGGWGGRERD